jgi:hypothetical protein
MLNLRRLSWSRRRLGSLLRCRLVSLLLDGGGRFLGLLGASEPAVLVSTPPRAITALSDADGRTVA